MEAKKADLLSFLDGVKQFIIPIYQRTYSWQESECQQLWEDIEAISASENTNSHFVGSFVYINQGGIRSPVSINSSLLTGNSV